MYFIVPKYVLGSVPNKDMQTSLLSIDPTFMKDAQCDESNENQFFDFTFFELS